MHSVGYLFFSIAIMAPEQTYDNKHHTFYSSSHIHTSRTLANSRRKSTNISINKTIMSLSINCSPTNAYSTVSHFFNIPNKGFELLSIPVFFFNGQKFLASPHVHLLRTLLSLLIFFGFCRKSAGPVCLHFKCIILHPGLIKEIASTSSCWECGIVVK